MSSQLTQQEMLPTYSPWTESYHALSDEEEKMYTHQDYKHYEKDEFAPTHDALENIYNRF